jgi:hypothetical protein
MRIRSGRGRGIISDDEDNDKSKVKLPKTFLGKIVSLFFLSVIIYIIFLYTKYF